MEQMVPAIRRATPADVAALVELRLAFQQELEPIEDAAAWEWHTQAVRRYFTEKLASGELLVWVAETPDEMVSTGALILVPKPPTQQNPSGLEAFVFNMYTVPAWRGKGLATRVLEEMIRFVKSTEARRIWLYASAKGEPVYAKAGFTIKRRFRPEMELLW